MFDHTTVLLEEAVDELAVKEDGIYVDCTLGGAGHSEKIAKQLTTGHLYCFDQDEVALQAAKERLAPYADRITFIHSNFKYLKLSLRTYGVKRVDGVLYDLGVSSPQFDTPERGFSYRFDAPLDMRMDQNSPLTARDIVNDWPYEELVRIFFRYGEEKFAKNIARKIEQRREEQPIETTGELVELIKEGIPAAKRRTGGHPAKRVFQALRIAVNDELGAMEKSIQEALEMIQIGGRVAVITFHSLEDRLCKTMFREVSAQPDLPPNFPIVPEHLKPNYRLVNRKPIAPSEEEVEANRRARSARLRVIERVKEGEDE